MTRYSKENYEKFRYKTAVYCYLNQFCHKHENKIRTITAIKSRRMGVAGHVTRMRIRQIHTVFWYGNVIGRKRGTPAPRWEGNTKPSQNIISLSYT